MPRLTTLALAILALVGASSASAQNWPESKLDAVASHVAGHPVSVWCEDNWRDWIHTGDSVNEDWSYVGGFTVLSTPTVYLAPDVCETLHVLAKSGPSFVGAYHASWAVQALVHEGVHQRGVADEGETDCAALSIVGDIAVRHFGYKRTERQAYVHKRKVKGRSVTSVRYRQVPSPALAAFTSFAQAWHDAAPDEYQGTC
jgi:hypothetical protein